MDCQLGQEMVAIVGRELAVSRGSTESAPIILGNSCFSLF